MEYMGDKAYWDEKFRNRGEAVLEPEKSLVENLSYLKKGSVLDIACGDGKNTLYLIQRGFIVTGLDFSEEALERLKYFADLGNLSVNTLQMDLSRTDATKAIGIFDNIVINHYRLEKTQYKELINHLSENGILFVSGFGEKHKYDSRIREEDLIKSSDFEGIKDLLDLIKYDEIQDERGSFVTYIFKRLK